MGHPVNDWGNTYLKLKPSGSTLKVSDYFTPTTLAFNTNDDDLGTSTAILLPDQSGTFPHVMLGGDKLGTLYVLNRDNMGKYHSSGDQVLQEIRGAVGVRLSSATLSFLFPSLALDLKGQDASECSSRVMVCEPSSRAFWQCRRMTQS